VKKSLRENGAAPFAKTGKTLGFKPDGPFGSCAECGFYAGCAGSVPIFLPGVAFDIAGFSPIIDRS
jgi:hypothetical protein